MLTILDTRIICYSFIHVLTCGGYYFDQFLMSSTFWCIHLFRNVWKTNSSIPSFFFLQIISEIQLRKRICIQLYSQTFQVNGNIFAVVRIWRKGLERPSVLKKPRTSKKPTARLFPNSYDYCCWAAYCKFTVKHPNLIVSAVRSFCSSDCRNAAVRKFLPTFFTSSQAMKKPL